jgi:hypothetical protein
VGDAAAAPHSGAAATHRYRRQGVQVSRGNGSIIARGSLDMYQLAGRGIAAAAARANSTVASVLSTSTVAATAEEYLSLAVSCYGCPNRRMRQMLQVRMHAKMRVLTWRHFVVFILILQAHPNTQLAGAKAAAA